MFYDKTSLNIWGKKPKPKLKTDGVGKSNWGIKRESKKAKRKGEKG